MGDVCMDNQEATPKNNVEMACKLGFAGGAPSNNYNRDNELE